MSGLAALGGVVSGANFGSTAQDVAPPKPSPARRAVPPPHLGRAGLPALPPTASRQSRCGAVPGDEEDVPVPGQHRACCDQLVGVPRTGESEPDRAAMRRVPEPGDDGLGMAGRWSEHPAVHDAAAPCRCHMECRHFCSPRVPTTRAAGEARRPKPTPARHRQHRPPIRRSLGCDDRGQSGSHCVRLRRGGDALVEFAQRLPAEDGGELITRNTHAQDQRESTERCRATPRPREPASPMSGSTRTVPYPGAHRRRRISCTSSTVNGRGDSNTATCRSQANAHAN